MAFEGRKNFWVVVGLVALALVWGTQFLVIKAGQVDLPPLLTATLRFAVLTAAAQVAVVVTHSRAPLEARLRRVSFGITQAIAFGLLYWAQGRIPSALAGVLSATTPLFVAMFAHRFVAGEQLSHARAAALILGFTGVSLIVSDTRSATGAAEAVAVLAILVGELASATNKVLAKHLTVTVPAPLLLRDMGLIVTILIGLASFYFERNLPLKFTPASVLAFAYLGLVASFAASGLYLILLRRYTVTAMSYLQFATAAVAALAGVLLGGERLSKSLILGILAVLGGLLLLSKKDVDEASLTHEELAPRS